MKKIFYRIDLSKKKNKTYQKYFLSDQETEEERDEEYDLSTTERESWRDTEKKS